MATLLYIIYVNGLYHSLPDTTLQQERTFFETVGNGLLMKLFVVFDIVVWVVGFISLGFWYWKIF